MWLFSVLSFFTPLAKAGGVNKTKIYLSGASCMPSIKVVANILPIQVSVMILLILITKSNCIEYGGQIKKFCKAFYMTFRKANTHEVDITDRKAMPYFCGLFFFFCYSRLNYNSWCQLFSFFVRKKKSFCLTIAGELLILYPFIFLLLFWLPCISWARLKVCSVTCALRSPWLFRIYWNLLINRGYLKLFAKSWSYLTSWVGFLLYLWNVETNFRHCSNRRVFNCALQNCSLTSVETGI